jgi:hypothetical protein
MDGKLKRIHGNLIPPRSGDNGSGTIQSGTDMLYPEGLQAELPDVRPLKCVANPCQNDDIKKIVNM